MIGRTNIQLKKRVLLVDADLGSPTSACARVRRERVNEPRKRNNEVVKATSVFPDSRVKCQAPCIKAGDLHFWYLK